MGSSKLARRTIRKIVGKMDIYMPSPFSPNSLAKTIFTKNSMHSPAKAATASNNVPLKNVFILSPLIHLTRLTGFAFRYTFYIRYETSCLNIFFVLLLKDLYQKKTDDYFHRLPILNHSSIYKCPSYLETLAFNIERSLNMIISS